MATSEPIDPDDCSSDAYFTGGIEHPLDISQLNDDTKNKLELVIGHVRCLLCRFRFQDGDTYVTDKVNPSQHFRTERSGQFRFVSLAAPIIERVDDIRCDIPALKNVPDVPCTPRGVAYHSSCLAAAESLFMSTPDFQLRLGIDWGKKKVDWRRLQETLSYFVPPTLTEEHRRYERTRQLLIRHLPALFPRVKTRLPPEIWCLIVDGGVHKRQHHQCRDFRSMPSNDFIQRCVVESYRSLWEKRSSRNGDVDLAKGVWAHYMFIDGVRYVARLSNKPDIGPGQSEPDPRACFQILRPGSVQKEMAVYVLEDHLGVRQILFKRLNQDISDLPLGNIREPWWRSFAISPETQTLRVVSDGLKIRYVQVVSTGEADSNISSQVRLLWRVPMLPSSSTLFSSSSSPPYRLIDLKGRKQQVTPENIWRRGAWHLQPMVCNVPGTTGYSAYWCDGRVVALFAHNRNDTASSVASLYRDATGRCSAGLWSHFPVGDDEILTDLHIVYPDPSSYGNNNRRDPYIMAFQTSRGRTWIIRAADNVPGSLKPRTRAPSAGPVHREKPADVHCSLVEGTTIHFSAAPLGVGNDLLAVTNAGPVQDQPATLLPLPPISAWGIPTALPRSGAEYSTEMFPGSGTDQQVIMFHGPYMVSTASLDGVSSVTPSYKWDSRDQCVVLGGLLLKYADKAPTALGEFRLDHVGPAIDVTAADDLYIGYSPRTTSPEPNIGLLTMFDSQPASLMEVTPSAADMHLERYSKLNWMRLPLKGMVDFWSSQDHGYIHSPAIKSVKTEPTNPPTPSVVYDTYVGGASSLGLDWAQMLDTM